MITEGEAMMSLVNMKMNVKIRRKIVIDIETKFFLQSLESSCSDRTSSFSCKGTKTYILKQEDFSTLDILFNKSLYMHLFSFEKQDVPESSQTQNTS